MTGETADLVEQLHLAVVEESWLWEVPLYVSEGTGGREHGPGIPPNARGSCSPGSTPG
jgi:hypothetical protein